MEHILPGAHKPHIAAVPGTNVVLRWFPYDGGSMDSITDTFGVGPSVQGLEIVQQYHAEHIDRLRRLSVPIPVLDHRAEVIDDNPSFLGCAAIYFTTWYVSGDLLTAEDERGHNIPGSLNEYYNGITDNDVVMGDLNRPPQYMVTDDVATLIDFDPRLAPGHIVNRLRMTEVYWDWSQRAAQSQRP